MIFDAQRDAVRQYREAISAGLNHANAVKSIEARLQQPARYYDCFHRTVRALAECKYLNYWWRKPHAPFELRTPRKPSSSDVPICTRGYIESWKARKEARTGPPHGDS